MGAGPYRVTAQPVSWLPYESPASGDRQIKSEDRRSDAPICQDTGLGGRAHVLASSIVCHDSLVDFAGEEAFEASNDVTFGPAVRRASGDVVDSRLMESHAHDDRSIESGIGLSMAASIEAVPASGHPGRGRDGTRAAEFCERGF